MQLTIEQIEAMKTGNPIRVSCPEIGKEVVLLRAEDYEEIREILEEEKVKKAIAQVGLNTAARWAQENPY